MDSGQVIIQPVIANRRTKSEKIDTGSNLQCIRQALVLDKFATGGNENPFKLWDLETGKVEFIAKSVRLYFSTIIYWVHFIHQNPT